MGSDRRVAYFSMEVGLNAAMPTYSGGLGVLAGDTLRAAADLRVPLIAVTMIHRKGYCRQRLDSAGHQSEEPIQWPVEDYLKELPHRVTVNVDARDVVLRAWQYDIVGHSGHVIPVYFLDANLPDNSEADRPLTDHLYGGDGLYRLGQETLLGVGGVRMLRAMGYRDIQRFHMNEGHASLLALELLDERLRSQERTSISDADVQAVRQQCVFTTHTPVPAGHDKFSTELVNRVLGRRFSEMLNSIGCLGDVLNMTYLALHLSHYVNGVAERHGDVSRQMFAPHPVESITNGVHVPTWVSPAFQAVFDQYIPSWRGDSAALRHAVRIPRHAIWEAHQVGKQRLIEYVNRTTNIGMDEEVFTITFARRAATYKRASLLFEDLERLRHMHKCVAPFQILYAGKAHPHDGVGKELIRKVFHSMERVRNDVKAVYLENYDIELCKLLTGGSDLWLNTPEPPLEASGTSGMKAALNGIPSLSIIDGWWVEGCAEGTTGWAIGRDGHLNSSACDHSKDADSLYDKLEYVILPMFYGERERYCDIMRHCIALNGSYFNVQRMMQEYVLEAYFR